MSSLTFSNASPFAMALPAHRNFNVYDADGDVIMTDAVTGLPITYGGAGTKRSRSASMDSDSADSRPSKRSRSSNEDEDAVVPQMNVCPPAPKKANPPPPPILEYGEDKYLAEAAARNLATAMDEAVLPNFQNSEDEYLAATHNLATAMAEAVLANEPADVGPGVVPPGDGPQQEEGWRVSVTVPDLALRLDMRHPRVVLNLLRFVKTYNELAPEGEEIHLPPIGDSGVNNILSHPDLANTSAISEDEAGELRDLVDFYRCRCYDCDGYDDYESEDSDAYIDSYRDSRYNSDSE